MNQPKKEVHSSVYQILRLVLVFYPASMYLFKVNNGNRRIICEIYSKLTIKAPERLRQWKHQNNI